jgi:hypothetical protein
MAYQDPEAVVIEGGVIGTQTVEQINALETSKANAAHSHVIADVTGLQSALDSKADSSHTHTASQVSGLGTAATKNITVSTAAPSGGSDGDIWIQY